MIADEMRARWVWALHIVLATSLWIPSGAAAQAQFRVQLAGTNVFDGEIHALFGADIGGDIGGDCQPGGPVCEVPNWTFLLAGYAGLVTDDTPLSAYAHIGIERKLTDQLSLGVVGFGFAHPDQGGAALRFDAMDVGAVKAGYGWGKEDGVLVALEIAWEFITDVFFR